MVTVTSEANTSRLEEIRRTNAAPRRSRGLGDDEAERLVHRGKAIVAMAYSIHSTEVGGTLSALVAAPRSPASDDRAAARRCSTTSLLVIPSHNPDGTQHRQPRGTARRWARRSRAATPPVLYHQYVGHDNNRDWYMFTQVESRLTVRARSTTAGTRRSSTTCTRWARAAARLFVPPYVDPWEPNVDPALHRGGQRARHARGGAAPDRGPAPGRRGRALRRLDARARVPAHATAACGSCRRPLRRGSPRRSRCRSDELERGASEYDPRRRLRQLPRALAGRDLAAPRHRGHAARAPLARARARRRRTASTGCARHSR